MTQAFLSKNRAVQSWYVVARSEELRNGSAITRNLLHDRIAVYRSEEGNAYALAARCPHMGADLGQALVRGDRIACAFHRWEFLPNGKCLTQARSAFAYPCEERFGLIWVFNGPRPLFEIPDFPGFAHFRANGSTLAAHPHLLAANGLDVAHFESVHGLKFEGTPHPRIVDRYRMEIDLTISLRSPGLVFRFLRMLSGDRAHARFSTYGGNLATIHAQVGAIPIYVLFTHRPIETGNSASQTLFFFPPDNIWSRWIPLKRLLGIAIMYAILRDDVELLGRVDFRADGIRRNEPMSMFRSLVNKMETFSADDF